MSKLNYTSKKNWPKIHKQRSRRNPHVAKIFREDLLSRLTEAERLLFDTLKEHIKEPIQLQHIVYSYFNFYIVDIYLCSTKLGIEVDGKYHEAFKQRDQDRIKEITLLKKGISLVRFKNEEIFNDVKAVVNEICSIIEYLKLARKKANRAKDVVTINRNTVKQELYKNQEISEVLTSRQLK